MEREGRAAGGRGERERHRTREEVTNTLTQTQRMLKLVELSPSAVGSFVRLSVSYCILDNSLSCFDLSPAHQKVECTFHITIRVERRWKLNRICMISAE